MSEKEQSTLQKLLGMDVSEYTEKKNGLTYLSWAHAWKEFIKVYPEATYHIVKDDSNRAAFGDEKQGYMVYTQVSAGGLTHEMWLPVMDHRNKSIMTPTTFDVNKAIMRCLTKNLAMFGLGLHIFTGEDLPRDDEAPATKKPTKAPAPPKKDLAATKSAIIETFGVIGKDSYEIAEYVGKPQEEWGEDEIKKLRAWYKELTS